MGVIVGVVPPSKGVIETCGSVVGRYPLMGEPGLREGDGLEVGHVVGTRRHFLR